MRPLCVDTSFLVDLWLEYYPPDSWPDLWNVILPDLIEKGVFFAPHEVYQELSGKAADLKRWAYANRRMFRNPDLDTCNEIREILGRSPQAVSRHKRGPHADVLIVAMAKTANAIVVTRERRDGSDTSSPKPRIPTLCKIAGVECFVTVREFREHIAWPPSK